MNFFVRVSRCIMASSRGKEMIEDKTIKASKVSNHPSFSQPVSFQNTLIVSSLLEGLILPLLYLIIPLRVLADAHLRKIRTVNISFALPLWIFLDTKVLTT